MMDKSSPVWSAILSSTPSTSSTSSFFPACINTGPRYDVYHVLFSTGLNPIVMANAQGWRIDSAFIGLPVPGGRQHDRVYLYGTSRRGFCRVVLRGSCRCTCYILSVM